jgi:hypothetical protein
MERGKLAGRGCPTAEPGTRRPWRGEEVTDDLVHTMDAGSASPYARKAFRDGNPGAGDGELQGVGWGASVGLAGAARSGDFGRDCRAIRLRR